MPYRSSGSARGEKWGQGAKDIGGEVKINVSNAHLKKGYIVIPDRKTHRLQKNLSGAI